MPFLLGLISLLYYLPYVCFQVTSHDLIKLREKCENNDTDAETILKYFFRIRVNALREPRFVIRQRKRRLVLRFILSMLVHIFYIIVNVVTFFTLDYVVNNKFSRFGSEMFKWSQLNDTEKFDYLGSKKTPKPSKCYLMNQQKDLQCDPKKTSNLV